MRRSWIALLLALCSLAWGQGRSCTPFGYWQRPDRLELTQALTRPTREPALALFDAVAADVAERYLDERYGGLNLPQATRAFRHRMASVRYDQEAYALLEAFVGCLADEHSYFLSPEGAEWDRINSLEPERGVYAVGVDFTEVGNRLYVHYTYPGSFAERAGLRHRDRILAVNGERDRLAERFWNEPLPLHVLVRTPGGRPRRVVLGEGHYEPRAVPVAYRLPLAPEVGYIRLPSFFDDEVGELFEQALTRFRADGAPLQGLVLDLRGNSGGLIAEAGEVLGQLVHGAYALERGRDREKVLYAPRGAHLGALSRVPLAVLVDGHSESAAELVAASLQRAGRAWVVGQRSAANTEVLAPFAYEGGSELWLAVGETFTLGGSRIGDLGVIPDAQVAEGLTWLEYPETHDPYILRALELLR